MFAQGISADQTAALASCAGPPRGARLAAARLTAVGLVRLGSLAMALSMAFPVAAAASTSTAAQQAVRVNCAAAPGRCGYPDAANTGVPRRTKLRSVPGQLSRGPGWHFDYHSRTVEVTGTGAVLSGLYIRDNLDITASHVTIRHVHVVTGGRFAISMRHIVGVTIENSTISGRNAGTGRVDYAIDDIYGDSAGMTIRHNNISRARTGVQVSSGLVTGNYIHAFGYIAGDHTNGVFVNGTAKHLTISHNTILNNLSQTDAINLDASTSGQRVAHKTITDNLLGGGAYAIYGGNSLGNATSHLIIKGNRFSQLSYATGGQFGPVGYYSSRSAGNHWTGNIWDTTGRGVPAR